METKKLKIAFMGSRGIPARYSGFETFYEQLGARLVKRGHDVTVYNRAHHVDYKEPFYKGIRLVRLPTLQTKHLDTIIHSVLSVIHGSWNRYDIVYFCGAGNAPLTILPRLYGAKSILNVDGADWKRDKWGKAARLYLRLCEYLATRLPYAVIADSRVIQKWYKERFQYDAKYIPYGSNIVSRNFEDEDTSQSDILKRFGLEKNGYILFVGRLVPENGAHLLISAFNALKTDLKLVIVGDAPYAMQYKNNLWKAAGKNVIFTGYAFGEDYSQISLNAYFFVLPSRVDGTRPVILDQLGFGNCVLVSNSPANVEVIGDAGLSYEGSGDFSDLRVRMQYLIDHPEVVERLRQKSQEYVSSHYTWESVTNEYEQLFYDSQKPARTRVPKEKVAIEQQEAIPDRANILGIGVHALNMQSALDRITASLESRKKDYVCVTTVNEIMIAQKDQGFRKILNHALVVAPDGMPTVWVGRIQGYSKMKRVYGPDLMREVCRMSVEKGYTHFLYGGVPGVAQQLKENLTRIYPGIKVIGSYTPPFRNLDVQEENELTELVKQLKPDILWVGLGAPRREEFMAKYLDRLDIKLMIGVGAAFDFLTDRLKEAPQWVKNLGLQWLHRLLQEPRRLWKRYALNNPAFLYKISLQLLGLEKYSLDE
jgi:exopolysaccharide biosynthesis WecB/TagA/CpsF family protein